MHSISSLGHAWGQFLSEHHWQAFGTLTFADPVNDEQGRRAATAWLTRLQSMAELSPHVYAFIGFERGPATDLVHCHLLLGGLLPRRGQRPGRSAMRTLLTIARGEWQHGVLVEIEPYDPKRGGAWYVTKFPNGGEILGRMSRHRHHLPRQFRAHSDQALPSQ